MPVTYIYDGTFEGLLTAIHYALAKAEPVADILKESGKPVNGDLFSSDRTIGTDIEKSRAVDSIIREKMGREAQENVLFAFLSEMEGIEKHIYNYIKFGGEKGRDTDKYLTDPAVYPVHRASERASREGHRLLGFVRFADAGGIFYAKITPDGNMLPIIIPHFKERFGKQKWIIHDEKRGMAAFHDGSRVAVKQVESLEITGYTEDEKKYADMWKSYFGAMEIKSRENLKLQQHLVPKKYQKNMTEFGG
jgi:probable DNA metabolism protein